MKPYEQVQSELRESPKRWLVTGCAGFIGSHLLETLLKLDQDVVGLDNFSTGKPGNLDEVQSLVTPERWARFRFMEGDTREPAVCEQACAGADYVLHQAALGSVPRSINDPAATHANNVTGCLNMLVAARDAKVKRFVYASSSSVYGDHPGLPKVEDKVGRPLSPYAASKAMCEMYAAVFARSYGMETIGLRYFNVFGPRQDPDGPYAAVIPKWIAAILNGEQVYINGDGETSRDFCYVANAVQANLLAATAPCNQLLRLTSPPAMPDAQPGLSAVYNIAAADRTSLNQLYRMLQYEIRELQPDLPTRNCAYRDFRAGDVRHSLADISSARQALRYEPRDNVSGTLASVICWFAPRATAVH